MTFVIHGIDEGSEYSEKIRMFLAGVEPLNLPMTSSEALLKYWRLKNMKIGKTRKFA